MDYVRNLEFLHYHLTEADSGEITVGPKYRISGQRDIPLEVYALYMDIENSLLVPPRYRSFSLLGVAYGNQVIGLKNSDLYVDTGTVAPTYTSKGLTEVQAKKYGLSTLLELVHGDMLQREANRIGAPIAHKVINFNGEQLDWRKQELNLSPKVLKLMEEEQARWQSVYGPNGKLGVNKQGYLVKYPQIGGMSYEHIDEINLERADFTDESGRELAAALTRRVVYLNPGQEEQRQYEEKQKLDELIQKTLKNSAKNKG